MNRTLAVVVAALLPAAALAEATTTWTVDPAHSTSGFAVKHLVVTTVRGSFGKTTGTVQLDDQDVTKSKAEATIDATTINTHNADRDTHLKSPDFFDTANHPTITFKSTKVEKAGDDKLKVTGDLTMRGVTKPVVLDVAYTKPIKGPKGELRRALSATGKVNRKDFGLNWSKSIEAGPVVSDNVDLLIDAELIQGGPAEKTAAKAANEGEKK